MTLTRYAKNAEKAGGVENLTFGFAGRFKQVFTDEQEYILQKYLKTAANIYYGLSPTEVRNLAYECAVAFNVNVPDSWESNKRAGPDWFSGFMKRHPSLSIRTPEATSLSRATSFNRENVERFFKKLAQVMDREKLQPSEIWNSDETGITTVQKPRNIVAAKGVKQIGTLTSAERESLVTMCAAVSATGNTVRPCLYSQG